MSIALIISLAVMAAPQSAADQADPTIRGAAKPAAYRDAPNLLDDMAAKRRAKPAAKRGKTAKPKTLACAAGPCPTAKP